MAATALSRTPAADAAAALAYARGVELIENRTRVGVLLQGIVAPLAPLPPVAFGFPAFSIAVQPKPVPEAVFAKDYREQIRKEQIHNLYENDVKQFRDKLGEINRDSTALLGTKPDKAKADKAKAESRKLVDEWVKERGLTLAATAEARDRIALTTDPALKPLNDVAFPDPDGTNSLSRKFYDLVDYSEYTRKGFRMPETFEVRPFQPDWFPFRPFGDDEKPTFLVWMSEELPPTAYPNLTNANNLTKGEMAKRVERAWKLDKARVLAKAEADKLADQVRAITKTVATDPSGVDKQLIDLAGQMKVRKFELYRLAKLQHDHGATSAGGGGYRPPTIEPLFVRYPTRFFADELLELRNKPLGEVTVLADAPRVKYYVACSVKKFEKPLDTFRDDVFTKTNAISPNPLYVQYALREERNKANREVGLRLRAEAGLELTDEFKKGERRESE